MPDKQGKNDIIERYVAYILRIGAFLSGLFVLIGAVHYLVRYGADLPQYKVFNGEPADLRTVHGIIREALSVQSRAIIQFGLLLLMFTPLTWITFLFFAFLWHKDRSYIVITAIVLSALLLSLSGT